MSINVSENDPKVVEAILRKDFYAFIQAVFPLVSPNRPLMRNWHLEAMAYAFDSRSQRRNPAADHHGATAKPEINLRVGCIPGLCAGAQTRSFASFAQAMPRIWRSPFKKLSRRHAFPALPPTISAHQNRPGSRQPDGICNHAWRLPDGHVGRRNFDRTRRKFRHYRRPHESSGYVLRNSAGDRLGMVRTHSSLPARQQGGGLNCGGDAAPSCR